MANPTRPEPVFLDEWIPILKRFATHQVVRRGLPRHLADDVVQDCCIRLLTHARFDPDRQANRRVEPLLAIVVRSSVSRLFQKERAKYIHLELGELIADFQQHGNAPALPPNVLMQFADQRVEARIHASIDLGHARDAGIPVDAILETGAFSEASAQAGMSRKTLRRRVVKFQTVSNLPLAARREAALHHATA